MVRLRGDFLQSRETFLDKLPMNGIPPGPDSVYRTNFDQDGLFKSAELRSVYLYLRGGTGLKLPKEWRAYMEPIF